MTEIFGRGGLPFVRIESPWSAAEIYLQGATITHFEVHGGAPVLFLSEQSRFGSDAPIRGGIPIVFPWFGKPEGRTVQHGFARLRKWELIEVQKLEGGSVQAHFTLPESAELLSIPVDYHVTVGKSLTAEVVVRNFSSQEFTYESCLHTYFNVGDINRLSVRGLQETDYLDALEGKTQKRERSAAITFQGEVDRIYVNAPQSVEIVDPVLKRSIQIVKEGSESTVVWNPWSAKARAMADFGDEEYQRMVCVESGNVASNEIVLGVGQEARMKIEIRTSSLG